MDELSLDRINSIGSLENQTVEVGSSIYLNEIVSSTLSDGSSYSWLNVIDRDGGNNFVKNGLEIDASGGTWISSDDLSNTVIKADAELSEQTLWFRTYGNGVYSDWDSLVLTSKSTDLEEENKVFIGTNSDNIIKGSDGNDTINGLAGNDTIDGGAGNDIIYGGPGDDIINDGNGDDIVDAGEGIDTYTREFNDNNWIAHIDLKNEGLFSPSFPGIKDDEFKNFENVNLKGSADTIVTGNDKDNVISTGTGADKLYGEGGNDILTGGAGNDTMTGGSGDDRVTGGSGADTFKFGSNFGNDIITDFENGIDSLDYNGNVTVGASADNHKMYIFEDGSTITLLDVEASNPNHHSFTTGKNNFTLVSFAKSYQDAVDYASGMGGKLASLNSSTKFEGFYNAISKVISTDNLTVTTASDGGNSKYVWLGATDQLSEGNWIWENGNEMNFEKWGSGALGSEPDNFYNQDALAIGLENWPSGSPDGTGFGSAGYWNDLDINNELFFVVEI